MRRGGCFYRVFESPERRFNFRELMAWCRWGDAKTCCEYLVTKNMSDAIDPRLLLERRVNVPSTFHTGQDGNAASAESIAATVVELLRGQNVVPEIPVAPTRRQQTMLEFAVPKSIPTARSGKEAWDQWFFSDPKRGVLCALKDYMKQMIKCDRRKYSERQTLAVAFSKFQTFAQFESEFAPYTKTYSGLLKEVRKRKHEITL
ncbi:Aste57867_15224 [Aphanomyces stellatus]|uniref:Aste57867_15224 protein n=1 Tax=Aphanomyces stellatus TaxID=120398 RepID=A0A485L3L8_9STRA|nr:hypothetical protein As57867_015168 [Aphanomyces stellatus]VFT92033.1 Aste57867_15224 [Aphanomyces stellatus]